jgi:hypothetical protein
MSYCALDEAFLIPVDSGSTGKRPKKIRTKDVPPPLPDQPTETDVGTVLKPDESAEPVKARDTTSFFPVPGESESWEKAFMMDSDFSKTLTRPEIDGKSTLWRKIEQPLPLPVSVGAPLSVPTDIWSDMNKRLDKLTKQLESLTSTSNTQSTSELFMFVAIGLLLLLAIDTILRFASMKSTQTGGHRLLKIARDSLGRFRRN